MFDTIIIGGGISGLATAFEVLQRNASANVIVLESTERLGGNVRTLHRDGVIVDLGPDALLNTRKEAIALCETLGLSDTLISPEESSRRVLIAAKNKLTPLPDGLVFGVPTKLGQLISTPLLSWHGKLRAALDVVLPASDLPAKNVGDLIERRLGSEVKDRLVEPLIGAVYAADIDRLDTTVGLPFLASTKGSLVRALSRSPRGSGGTPFRAPANGMIALVDALATAVGPTRIRTTDRVARVRPHENAWDVTTVNNQQLRARNVVLAVPPHEALAMVGDDPELALALGDLTATTTATVVFAFQTGTELPNASGVLIPRTENRPTLAATFVNRKWSRPNPKGEVIVRAFLGGARTPTLIESSDDATLAKLALQDLRAFMKLPEPRWTTVARWIRATPHPVSGHTDRMAQLRKLLSVRKGMYLVGAAYEGPGIAGCAAQAARTAAAIVPRDVQGDARDRSCTHP